MSFEEAQARGRARAAAATAHLHNALTPPVVHAQQHLTTPRATPREDETPDFARPSHRWIGRGLRIEIGDRAYRHLVLDARQEGGPDGPQH